MHKTTTIKWRTNNGATTSVVVEAASGISFVQDVAIDIGSTTVVLANVNTATNSGVTTSVVITTAAGVNFAKDVATDIGSTTVMTLFLYVCIKR